MLLLLLEGIHFFFFFDKLVSWMPCAVCVCVCRVYNSRTDDKKK